MIVYVDNFETRVGCGSLFVSEGSGTIKAPFDLRGVTCGYASVSANSAEMRSDENLLAHPNV
jgi:hypothetical protein